MLLGYILIAFFIAWIWVDYFRLIDIYEKESLGYFILTFLMGASSVFIVFAIGDYIIAPFFPGQLNGNFFNDFFHCVFKIGIPEEIAKLIPFLILLLFCKKQINEPIDYLAYICVSALGFSAAENVLYFQSSGPEIINGRSILATVGHMFDSALIAYGIILYKYHEKWKSPWTIVFFFILAALSHGFYDFWLMYNGLDNGWIITILYFLITISVFAVILNNALNNSSFFSYKKVIDSEKVNNRLLSYYGLLFIIQFVLITYSSGFSTAMGNLQGSVFSVGFIIIVTTTRLSRFKLIKNRWHKLKLEFPFGIHQGDIYGFDTSPIRLVIKGDAFNEIYLNKYFQELAFIKPVSSRRTTLGMKHSIVMERKLFLKEDEAFYLARIFQDSSADIFEYYLIKAKSSGTTMIRKKFPIVALLKLNHIDLLDLENDSIEDFKFVEWCVIKGRN